MALAIQLLGLLFLSVGLWLGYRQWIRPHDAKLTWAGRGLLILVVLTFMGGFIGSPFWWSDQPWSFSWDLPPLAGRMLGAAGWSFAAVTFIALRQPTYRRLRLILLLLFVYLAPLAIIILLFHLDRFDFSAPITYAFFAIAVPMAIVATWYLLRQPRLLAGEVAGRVDAAPPTNVVLRVWLLIVAAITLLWGIALLVTDSGPSAQIWAWPGDLLTSRLIAVMLLTIAFGCLFAFRHADTARMMVVMILVYSLGLTVAALWNLFFGLPIKTLYISVFSVIFLVTTVLFLADRQPNQSLVESKLPSPLAKQ